MTLMLFTFVMTTLMYVALVGLAGWWITQRMQGRPEAAQALTQLLVLLLAKRGDEPEKKKVPKDTRLC